jgi:hypothetical protein
MKLSCRSALGKDRHIAFSLILKEQFVLRLEAWVAWQRAVDGHYLYGLYFTKIKDADKEAVYQFLQRQLPEQAKQFWGAAVADEKGDRAMEGQRLVDRRVFERLPAEVAVRLLDTASGQELQAKSVDVSAKGIGLLAAENLHLGAELELWLKLPANVEPLYSRGTLVWSMPEGKEQFRMGINLEKADLMGLGRLLRA